MWKYLFNDVRAGVDFECPDMIAFLKQRLIDSGFDFEKDIPDFLHEYVLPGIVRNNYRLTEVTHKLEEYMETKEEYSALWAEQDQICEENLVLHVYQVIVFLSGKYFFVPALPMITKDLRDEWSKKWPDIPELSYQ